MSYPYSKLNWNTFRPYRNKHKNDIATVCGTGETLTQYKVIDEALHIGCNSCVYYDKLNFDYLFFQDCAWGSKELKNKIQKYNVKSQKFIGTFIGDHGFGCSQKFAIESDALWYDTQGPMWGHPKGNFQKDIDKHHFGDAGVSTIFICMQFALFAGFKEINIVGCDISGSKHFHKQNRKSNLEYLKKSWALFRSFVDTEYPNVQINVINPIGLKGFFYDKYQA